MRKTEIMRNHAGFILANLLHIFFDSYFANTKNMNVITSKIDVITYGLRVLFQAN